MIETTKQEAQQQTHTAHGSEPSAAELQERLTTLGAPQPKAAAEKPQAQGEPTAAELQERLTTLGVKEHGTPDHLKPAHKGEGELPQTRRTLTHALTEADYLKMGETEHAREAKIREEYRKLAESRAQAGKSNHLAELLVEFHDVDWGRKDNTKDYTPEEDFYLYNGWKAYLEKYGEHATYSLEEIAETEDLDVGQIGNVIDAGQIEKAIADGTLKDPSALRVYAKLHLEHTKANWHETVAKFEADPELAPDLERIRREAESSIKYAEEECLLLLNGSNRDLARYAAGKADLLMTPFEISPVDDFGHDITEENKKRRAEQQAQASYWYEMAARCTREGGELATDQRSTLDYVREQPTQLPALRALRQLPPESIQTLTDAVKAEKKAVAAAQDEGKSERTSLLQMLIDLLESFFAEATKAPASTDAKEQAA